MTARAILTAGQLLALLAYLGAIAAPFLMFGD